MRAGRTAPYIRPDQRAFFPTAWRMAGGREIQDGELIREWDQNLCLSVARVVEIDLGIVAGSGRLQPGAELAVVPTWWSEGTGMRGGGEPAVFEIDGSRQRRTFELLMKINGHELAQSVQLRSALVLLKPTAGMSRDPLAPRRRGSTLWEDSAALVLEGSASRFPISTVDFVESGLGPANACWRLEWSPDDLSLPAMACMRLYLNEGHRTFHAAATSQDPDPAQHVMRSALKYGVGEEMVRLALDRVDDLMVGDFSGQPSAVGKVFLDLLGRLFPGQSATEVNEMRRTDPGSFHTSLQARLALFSASGDGRSGQ